MEFPTVFSVVDIAIFIDNQLVVGKKANRDKYQLLGGHVDPKDENYVGAAKREAEEECGLDIAIDQFTEVWRGRVNHRRYIGTPHAVFTNLYFVQLYSPLASGCQLQPGDDIVEIALFDWDDLLKQDFREKNIMPYHLKLLGRIMDSKEDEIVVQSCLRDRD